MDDGWMDGWMDGLELELISDLPVRLRSCSMDSTRLSRYDFSCSFVFYGGFFSSFATLSSEGKDITEWVDIGRHLVCSSRR